MNDTTAELGGSAAAATKAAKARFVQIDPEALRTFLAAQDGLDNVEIRSYNPVTDGAGASNGIALFTAVYTRHGRHVEQDLVLRYMPGVQLLKQKSYADEFATVAAVHAAGLPAPQPLWLDADGALLGFPGYVMERVDGRSPESGMFLGGLLAEVTPDQRRSMVLAAAGFHGRLRRAAIGADAVPHLAGRGTGSTAVQRELNWWLTEARLAVPADNDKLAEVEQLCAWMIDHEPKTLRPASLVHGDAQIANIMFRDDELAAVVDWELSYLGHGEADLALVLFLTATHGAAVPDMAGIPSAADLIARFEHEAGGPVEHLEYFTLLNFVKMLSIYLMLGDNLPDLDAIWAFHINLVEQARSAAAEKG